MSLVGLALTEEFVSSMQSVQYTESAIILIKSAKKLNETENASLFYNQIKKSLKGMWQNNIKAKLKTTY